MKLAEQIKNTTVESGSVAIFYLGQAGFWFKTASGLNIVIDVYLSDAAERLFGFKRMSPPVLDAEDLNVDFYLATHSHIDHLDTDILPVVAKKDTVHFIGAPDCEQAFRDLGMTKDRFTILRTGERVERNGVSVRAIDADHGDLAPEATGLLMTFDGLSIYHAGDTSFQPDRIRRSLAICPDVMIVPINGAFGNLTAQEACRLTSELGPKLVIPCHFWTFLEHVAEGGKGDPTTFLREAKSLPDETRAVVLPPGRSLVFP